MKRIEECPRSSRGSLARHGRAGRDEGRGREGTQKVVAEVVVVGQAASPLQLRALCNIFGHQVCLLPPFTQDISLMEYAHRSYAQHFFPLLAHKLARNHQLMRKTNQILPTIPPLPITLRLCCVAVHEPTRHMSVHLSAIRSVT